jgi:hypothetical protein
VADDELRPEVSRQRGRELERSPGRIGVIGRVQEFADREHDEASRNGALVADDSVTRPLLGKPGADGRGRPRPCCGKYLRTSGSHLPRSDVSDRLRPTPRERLPGRTQSQVWHGGRGCRRGVSDRPTPPPARPSATRSTASRDAAVELAALDILLRCAHRAPPMPEPVKGGMFERADRPDYRSVIRRGWRSHGPLLKYPHDFRVPDRPGPCRPERGGHGRAGRGPVVRHDHRPRGALGRRAGGMEPARAARDLAELVPLLLLYDSRCAGRVGSESMGSRRGWCVASGRRRAQCDSPVHPQFSEPPLSNPRSTVLPTVVPSEQVRRDNSSVVAGGWHQDCQDADSSRIDQPSGRGSARGCHGWPTV